MADLRPGLFNRLASQGGRPGLDQRVAQQGLVRAQDPQGDPMALARALMAMSEQGQTPRPPMALPEFAPAAAPMPSRQGGYDAPVQQMPPTSVQAPALPSPTAATQPQIAPEVPPMPDPTQIGQPTVDQNALAAIQQRLALLDQQKNRLLPEQWKGAFTTPPGMPG